MKKYIKPFDVMIALIVVISAVLMMAGIMSFFDKEANTLEVYLDGQLHSTYELSKYNPPETIVIKSKYGYNKIEIDGLVVRPFESTCPDKIEILDGPIDKPGQVLVCMPNRLVLKITHKE